MAHHNSTPQSVLDAPTSKPEVVSRQIWWSRQERRHGTPKVTPEDFAAMSSAGPNVPATSTRERKIRKGRKARWNR